MQRKQQVGECLVCVKFFARLALMSAMLHWVRRGGATRPPLHELQGGDSPPTWGFGGSAPQKKKTLGNVSLFFLDFHVTSIFVSIIGKLFGIWFFVDGFLFPVKELGLLTNPGHWIRFLDATGSYMYIVL
jgi:hypothetical protein